MRQPLLSLSVTFDAIVCYVIVMLCYVNVMFYCKPCVAGVKKEEGEEEVEPSVQKKSAAVHFTTILYDRNTHRKPYFYEIFPKRVGDWVQMPKIDWFENWILTVKFDHDWRKGKWMSLKIDQSGELNY